MRDALVPALTLAVALAIAGAFGGRRNTTLAVLACSVGAIALLFANRFAVDWRDALHRIAWIAVAATATIAYFPSIARSPLLIIVALFDGILIGGLAGLDSTRSLVIASLVLLYLVVAVTCLLVIRWPIVLRIVASWLIAASTLVTVLPFGDQLPGYAQDHLE